MKKKKELIKLRSERNISGVEKRCAEYNGSFVTRFFKEMEQHQRDYFGKKYTI